ncbi:hypothetical protein ASC94_20860 [Massilia sp. Root418]|uniref:PEP-CTERM sorting domain-containing protein n=1 Tax=Massilia sp. Root418 TaxID=1736532 RepID=UPI0006F8BB71|nr:PEP-CTERM sorting domain-containing protein [Massilia sp. Root418]KQW90185.1 hypothetical protein ASC94_20860 [Massilia sp. Root418]
MNLKKLSALAAGVALAFGMAAPAQAVELVAGDIKFTFNAYDNGTIGYEAANPAQFGLLCNSVATCDTRASSGGSPAVNAYGADTWGIFSIATITRVSNGANIYTSGQGGKYLTGVFGGIQDYNVTRSDLTVINPDLGIIQQVLGVGGWLKMFSNNSNYDPTLGTAGRTGEFAYNGITGGALELDAVFTTGAVAGSAATYKNTFNEAGIDGGSAGYLDVVGGAMYSLLNTNAMVDLNGDKHDLKLSSTFDAFLSTPQVADWTVIASGQVLANALPEPGSLAIFGLGLAGLAALRRRKQQ